MTTVPFVFHPRRFETLSLHVRPSTTGLVEKGSSIHSPNVPKTVVNIRVVCLFCFCLFGSEFPPYFTFFPFSGSRSQDPKDSLPLSSSLLLFVVSFYSVWSDSYLLSGLDSINVVKTGIVQVFFKTQGTTRRCSLLSPFATLHGSSVVCPITTQNYGIPSFLF